MADNREYYTKPEDAGLIKISEEVIGSIAAVAASDIPGVESLVGGFTSDIAGLLGKKSQTKGARVILNGDSVSVEMNVVLKYGYVLPDVAKKVQDAVSNAVESMTGLHVGAVNVHVTSVVFEKDLKKGPQNPKGDDKQAAV